MTRIRSTTLCFALLLVFVIPMIAVAQEEIEPWTCPPGFEGQTLSIFNWSTYVVDEDDPETEFNEQTIEGFEELCGVTVVYSEFASNEDLLSKIRVDSTAYDIIVPTDYMVSIMAAEGLLRPINLDNIPNFANVSENLVNAPFDPGNQYSIPYQWGTIGIGYNVNKVDEPITSWYQVFSHNGPVAWLEDSRAMMGIALLLLGYDPNTDNPDEIAEARDFLIENGGNVVYIAQDDGQAWLERGEVDITVEYSGDIFQLIYDCECEDYAYVIPEEGAVRWVDNMAIPVGAKNPELAEVFMDYILDPQVGANLSNYTAYGTPNQAALDLGLIDEELLSDPGIYPSEETEERLFFIADVPSVEQNYNDAWEEVKILVGP